MVSDEDDGYLPDQVERIVDVAAAGMAVRHAMAQAMSPAPTDENDRSNALPPLGIVTECRGRAAFPSIAISVPYVHRRV